MKVHTSKSGQIVPTARAVASLTVPCPGGQESIHFPHSFLSLSWLIFLIFHQTFPIFFLILVPKVGDLPTGKALATPLPATPWFSLILGNGLALMCQGLGALSKGTAPFPLYITLKCNCPPPQYAHTPAPTTPHQVIGKEVKHKIIICTWKSSNFSKFVDCE